MSQESDCSTCSQLSISQETLELMWRSVSDITSSVCNNFTQITSRDPSHTTDLQFSVEDGDTTLLIDKFQIARNNSVTNTQQTTESSPLRTDQNNSVVLNSMHCDHSNSSSNQSSDVIQGSNANVMLPLPAFSSKFPSNLPYGGNFHFEMSLTAQSKETKAVDWTYSELLRKVFVRFGQSCPFRFRTTVCPPSGTVLRAMPIYVRPQHVQEAVKRCPTHAAKTAPDNIGAAAPADHLIRCDHKLARYEQDSYTGFHSVVLPYVHPAEGIDWTINLYQFMCFSSCVGGLNRRPVQVVFSLESVEGNVLGRQSIEVRICACPGRDRQAEEKNSPPVSSTQVDPNEKLSAVTNEITTISLPAKRRRLEEDEVFTLSVRGLENYEILHRLRDKLEVASAIPQTQFEKVKRQQEEFRQSQTVSSVKSVSNYSNNGLPSSNLFAGSAVAETSSCVQQMPQKLPYGVNCANIKSEEIVETNIDSWLTQRGLRSCSAVFHKNNVVSTSQLNSLSLEDLEQFGLSDDLLAAVWLALSRDSRRQACKNESASAKVTNTGIVMSASNVPASSSVSTHGDNLYEVTRYTFKRRLSLPKENGNCQST